MHRHDDSGVTLVEVIISTVLMSVVVAAIASAMHSGRRVFTLADDEATGVIDIRAAVERLGRDVRNARALDAGATSSTLALWIDANSDYQRQADEVVTWTIVANGSHFDVRRQVGSGTALTQASTVVSAIAFCYRTGSSDPTADPLQGCINGSASAPYTLTTGALTAAQAKSARFITTIMTYDPRVSNGTNQRTVTFSERMRNVA